MNDVKKQINRASYLLMASMFLSRVIGFFREWVLARTVGATAITDVYYASFTIPDFLNYLMAAGALSISFIPLVSPLLARGAEGEQRAKEFFRSLTTWMGLILLVLILVAYVLAPQFARLSAPGFSEEQHVVLTRLLRIILPAQLFFYWGGLAIAVQHCYGRFLLPAIAPLVYNTGILSLGLLLHRRWGIDGFSWGVLLGAALSHGALQWAGIRLLGYSAFPSFRLGAETVSLLKRYFWLSLPISLGFSIVVTDEWISKYYASLLETRAVSWLSYARTQIRIPIAILGQAAGIASFPFLSRLWAEKRGAEFADTLFRECAKVWALAPLATVLVFLFSDSLTFFIYGGGKFGPEDLQATAACLRGMSWGLLFWILQIPLSRAFYAAQKTWLPSLVGTAVAVASFPLYAWLNRYYGYRGLALAGSIAMGIYVLLLGLLLLGFLRREGVAFAAKRFVLFGGLWMLVVAVLYGGAILYQSLGIFRGTQLSAGLELVGITATVGGIAFVLLRKVFPKLTAGPLF